VKDTIYKRIMVEFANLNEDVPKMHRSFSTKEAQIFAEKDIQQMAKILGKASYQSIKKMIDGVKGGKYTSMDMIRAIKIGNIRYTHEGERDFLKVLWHKLKKIGRFKQYEGAENG
jgi:hypothetical protein